MREFKNASCFLALFVMSFTAHAELHINELMQSNIDCIMDDLNEFPDSWVELYNSGDKPVLLSDYSIGVKDKISKAYNLPAYELRPGGFVIIYCDKQGEGMHTDFRLDSSGGPLYLWHKGDLVESFDIAKMPAPNISFGRIAEDSDIWGYQSEPTPGEANCGNVLKKLLPDPVFSVGGGICGQPLSLKLSLPSDAPKEARVVYTLDGTSPTSESEMYTGPIKISESTVVRAMLVADGYLSPQPVAQSYIFHGRVSELPIVSLAGDPAYFYDDKIGILVEGTYSGEKENFQFDWRRPVNIEYFETDGSCPVNQLIETRVKGGSSRVRPLKSMVVYANKRFGTKRLDHEFFPDQKPGLTDFKSLELRNAGNDFYELYLRDAICQYVMGMNSNVDWAAVQPVVLYINGEYKGVLNMRERANEDYIYTNYEGLEDVDVIENWYLLKEGTMDNMNEFNTFYSQDGHSMAEYEDWMDVNEFMDYMIGNMFFCNTDFPSNNMIMWRSQAEGGKWRWIAKDMDTCLGFNPKSPELKYLNWLYDKDFDTTQLPGNAPGATLLFRNLLSSTEARELFIDKCTVALGDYLQPELFASVLDSMLSKTEAEHQVFKNLYNFDWEWNNRGVLADFVKEWVSSRWEFMYGHFADFWGLNDPYPLQVKKSVADNMSVSINGIELNNDFDGKFYPGRLLTVSAKLPQNSEQVVAWSMTTVVNGEEQTEIYPVSELTIPFPVADMVRLVPVVGTGSVDDVVAGNNECMSVWYDVQGRALGTMRPSTPGIYLHHVGTHVDKVVVR